MDQQQVFSGGQWLGAPDPAPVRFYFLRGRFRVHGVKRAVLRAVGLGFFECFLNGLRVTEDRFLPLNSDFEPRRDYPVDETLTGHRIWVPEYDVTHLLRDGENVLVLHFGGGWYDRPGKSGFGCAKAIWRVFGADADGAFDYFSTPGDHLAASFVTDYDFICRETQDLRLPCVNAAAPEFDDAGWAHAAPAAAPQTEYGFCDCPADRVCEEIVPVVSAAGVYDCGANITGTPVVRLTGRAGEKVTLRFAEEIAPSGALDPAYIHDQTLTFICGGGETEARALFTWFGFRYFTVEGPAEALRVEVIHTLLARVVRFECDNEMLCWLDRAFAATQLMNMHAGIPSDCPHKERRGYTGDGELACNAAMTTLDAAAFYRKWIRDIRDCQDMKTGHIQYTAPYIRSGGGPGGWGCAIVEVPWQFYKHYGDIDVLRDCYPQMLRYFDYLEYKSVNGLVAGDKPGEWCLGDWCTPESIILPAPFVNNYFYVKSLLRCTRIAPLIGREDDLPMLRQRIKERRAAITAAYYNEWDGNFLGCRQGANAFAVDIGLGDERTYRNLVAYYRRTGGFDTGIFGTDIVTRVLFEHGDGETAVSLLTSESEHSFAGMRNLGATTLWEYFPGSLRDRSHSHPMFGAVDAYLYEYILGIRQPENGAGWQAVEIAPAFVPQLRFARGGRRLLQGELTVEWIREGEKIRLTVNVPAGVDAVLRLPDRETSLASGPNRIMI